MKCNGVYALVVLRVFSHRHSPGRVPWYGQIEADHVAGEPRDDGRRCSHNNSSNNSSSKQRGLSNLRGHRLRCSFRARARTRMNAE